MSKYTVDMRWLQETNWDFGLKDYPIFDEDYRNVLNKKILQHYYFGWEIGYETPQLFTYYLNQKMREIMPYYNQLYKSELIEIEPLTRLDWGETYHRSNITTEDKDGTYKNKTDDVYTATHTDVLNVSTHDTDDGTSKTTDSNNTYTQGADSDTPQNATLDVKADFTDFPASNAQANNVDSVGKSDTTTKRTMDGTRDSTDTRNDDTTNNRTDDSVTTQDNEFRTLEDYTRKYTGNNASRTDSEMLMEFRKTFLNIDMMVIAELEPLFMSIY